MSTAKIIRTTDYSVEVRIYIYHSPNGTLQLSWEEWDQLKQLLVDNGWLIADVSGEEGENE